MCFTKLVSFVAFPGAYLLFSTTRAIFGVKVFGGWMMVVSGLCTYFQCLAVMIDYIFEEGLDNHQINKQCCSNHIINTHRFAGTYVPDSRFSSPPSPSMVWYLNSLTKAPIGPFACLCSISESWPPICMLFKHI